MTASVTFFCTPANSGVSAVKASVSASVFGTPAGCACGAGWCSTGASGICRTSSAFSASFSITESDPSSIVQSKLINIPQSGNATLRKVYSNNDKSLSLFNSLVNMKSVIEENPNEKSIDNNIDFGTISQINRENESLI